MLLFLRIIQYLSVLFCGLLFLHLLLLAEDMLLVIGVVSPVQFRRHGHFDCVSVVLFYFPALFVYTRNWVQIFCQFAFGVFSHVLSLPIAFLASVGHSFLTFFLQSGPGLDLPFAARGHSTCA